MTVHVLRRRLVRLDRASLGRLAGLNNSGGRVDRAHESGGRSLHERRASAGRWLADAGRFRQTAVGEHRVACRVVPREHEEKSVRVERDGQHPQIAYARPRSQRADDGLRQRSRPNRFWAQSPVLGLVLPSNSPGVHTLWLPIIPLQIRVRAEAGTAGTVDTVPRRPKRFFQAGIPREAISIYPGEAEVGAAVVAACGRSLIFGGTPTVERYKGNPHVQVHRRLRRLSSATTASTIGNDTST